MRKIFAKYLVFAAFFAAVNNAHAEPEFLAEWRKLYGADSPIDDDNNTECQICHISAGGGSSAGWNAYGWRVREVLQGFSSSEIARVIVQAGVSDSDQDAAGATNVTEIKLGNHPGWREGTSLRYFAGGNVSEIPTPASIEQTIDLDPPAPLNDPIPLRIVEGQQQISLETVSSGFISPLLAVSAPGVDGVLFVVDQVGVIWRVVLSDGSKTRFFDITAGSFTAEANASDLVTLGNAGFGPFDERGLLGLAFHPNYADNGKFYTYQSENVVYTADFSTIASEGQHNHQTVIAEWTVSDPNSAAPLIGSKRQLLVIDQPQFNHNGGMLAFGPDGYLYISIGDGGAADDQDVTIETINISTGLIVSRVLVDGHQDGNARNPANPLGAILRIDPDQNGSTNGEYGIPVSNPFDGNGTELAEVYAYGLRNSYRFSFDSANGNLYAADVGQNDIEEINLIEAGNNYGWNFKEGSFWFYPNQSQPGYVSAVENDAAPAGLVDPILEYDHDDGISVTGGYVYRGSELDEALGGAYIFADWSSDFGVPSGRLFYSDDFSRIQELRVAGQNSVGLFVTGFGQDTSGELYVVGNKTGSPTGETGVLQKIVPPVVDDEFCVPIKTQGEKLALVCL